MVPLYGSPLDSSVKLARNVRLAYPNSHLSQPRRIGLMRDFLSTQSPLTRLLKIGLQRRVAVGSFIP